MIHFCLIISWKKKKKYYWIRMFNKVLLENNSNNNKQNILKYIIKIIWKWNKEKRKTVIMKKKINYFIKNLSIKKFFIIK